MKIKVFIERENKNKVVDVKEINEIFTKLNINPNEILIVKNNELITVDEKLNENDYIKLLSVISGG